MSRSRRADARAGIRLLLAFDHDRFAPAASHAQGSAHRQRVSSLCLPVRSGDNDGGSRAAAAIRYSNLAPEAATTLPMRASSWLICAANSAGELPTAITPSKLSRSAISDELVAAAISLLSKSTTAWGVPAGAATPYHEPAS